MSSLSSLDVGVTHGKVMNRWQRQIRIDVPVCDIIFLNELFPGNWMDKCVRIPSKAEITIDKA